MGGGGGGGELCYNCREQFKQIMRDFTEPFNYLPELKLSLLHEGTAASGWVMRRIKSTGDKTMDVEFRHFRVVSQSIDYEKSIEISDKSHPFLKANIRERVFAKFCLPACLCVRVRMLGGASWRRVSSLLLWLGGWRVARIHICYFIDSKRRGVK